MGPDANQVESHTNMGVGDVGRTGGVAPTEQQMEIHSSKPRHSSK